MSVCRLPTTNQTGLLGDKPDVLAVADAAGLWMRQYALGDALSSTAFSPSVSWRVLQDRNALDGLPMAMIRQSREWQSSKASYEKSLLYAWRRQH